MKYVCPHENNKCNIVIVACPPKDVFDNCNKSIKKCLYESSVNSNIIHKQHSVLVATFLEHNIKVINLFDHIDIKSLKEKYNDKELGNIIFTRDPIICTPKGVIVGRFKEEIRRKETDIIIAVLKRLKIPILYTVNNEDSYIEGGDYIPAGSHSFIAIGIRTNMNGVQELMNKNLFGTDYVAVIKYPVDGNMHTIHLDCYMGIVNKKYAILWDVVTKFLVVDEYKSNKLVRKDIPIDIYLVSLGYEIILVPSEWQSKYSCNLLDIGNNKILTQDHYITHILKQKGLSPIYITYNEIHKMYGGIRCTTQVISRNKK